MEKIIANKIIDYMKVEEICESCFPDNSSLNAIDDVLKISNCVISKLDFSTYTTRGKVIVEKCFIKELDVLCAWFEAGLCFKNNIVESDIDYQMGGHNKVPIEIINNIFLGHYSFFDCQFEAQLIVRNNIFSKGTDLFYKENKGFDNDFQEDVIAEGNIGKLDIIL